MRTLRFLIFLASLATLISCDPQGIFDEYISTTDGKWGWHQVARFQVELADTVNLHDIYLKVRHSVDYPMSNLYMFVELEGPGGQHIRDTVNLILAAPDGRWVGSGNGQYRELALRYRQNIRFSEPGSYRFSLEQAMRKSSLPVTEVGLRIERINP